MHLFSNINFFEQAVIELYGNQKIINLLSFYRLQFFVFLDVDYKELVDESTRLYSKYEDPKELNDKEKKRLKNLTFISWRASLICQYKFEIFKAQYIYILALWYSLILVMIIACVRFVNCIRFLYISSTVI